jgi:hypothetical protein
VKTWQAFNDCATTYAARLVIPAQAGIQAAYPSFGDNHGPLDSRLRGNDEGKVVA